MTYKKVNGGLIDQISPPSQFQPCGTISEVELNAELDIARTAVTVENTEAAIGSWSHPAVECRVAEPVEAGMVEDVEELRAQLHSETFA